MKLTNSRLGGFLCAVFSVMTGLSLQSAEPPYSTDFESGMGPEWAVDRVDESTTNVFTKFSGRFGNDSQTITISNLVVGEGYAVLFDLYIIDSWDGGGDQFEVLVDGSQVFRESFANVNENQTYPVEPDEGGEDMGFSGYGDSIYRNVEVIFSASNSVSEIAFQGVGLQSINDESWGIDNVEVISSSDLPPTEIYQTTLPAEDATNAVAIDGFRIQATRNLNPESATNAANYGLRSAGVNGVFDDGDDVVYTLSPSLMSERSVEFTFDNAPLQPGEYRFLTKEGLIDSGGNAVTILSYKFGIEAPELGYIEDTSNDILEDATELSLTESPAASGFLSGFGIGTFSDSDDVDYWRFSAEAGDRLTVRLEADRNGIYPRLFLQNAAGSNQSTQYGSSDGTVQLQNFKIPSPGDYYLRLFPNSGSAGYKVRLDVSRGPQLEVESNNSRSDANPLTLTASPGSLQALVGGALIASDSAGDYYSIKTLNTGNAISVDSSFPAGSTVTGSNLILSIEREGGDSGTGLITNNTGTLNFTVDTDDVYFVRVQSTNRQIRAQYLLNVNITDGVPPEIQSVSLPEQDTTSSNVIDRFTLNFSEDMAADSMTNASNYELRAAGEDGQYDTADDVEYALESSGYSSGLTMQVMVVDGPLQPGEYRFIAGVGLEDRAGNAMAQEYERRFI
ncbi:MAG: Ig-like domain-containing protein, partial [Verrucomicrobia bacterium]|nr:Ig-like domain-containing protein [Verrucomicrobiota bacterium]